MKTKFFSIVVMCILLFPIVACSPTKPTEQVADAVVATEEPTHTPTPTVDPMIEIIRSATVFEADFEDGIPNDVLDREANWKIQQDDDNNVFCNEMAKGWTSFNFGNPVLENYAFEAKVKLVNGSPNPEIAMLLRFFNNAGYSLNVNKNNAFFAFIDPWENLGSGESNLENGKWHTFRVEALDKNLSFYIDGELKTTATAGEITAGAAGIAAVESAKICVDDLKLWTIDENGPVVLENVPGLFYINSIPTSPYFEEVELLESAMVSLWPIGREVHTIRTGDIYDMDGDGVNDVILHIITYPEMEYHPVVVLNGDGPVENIAEQVFPDGVVEAVHGNQMTFADINNDGLEDLLVSDSGLDKEPWYRENARIGIGLNNGDGTWTDISDSVPTEAIGLRNYSLAVGDFYNDGVIRILLPSQTITEEINGPELTGLLSWNGSEFEFKQNWIDMNLWWWGEKLYSALFMEMKDIDDDGWDDLYLGGGESKNNQHILYGGEYFPSANSLYALPETPYGHQNWEDLQQPGVESIQGANSDKSAIEDFDGDGDLDIVSTTEQYTTYKQEDGSTVDEAGNMWLQVLRNDGDRQFTDFVEQGRDIGYYSYITLFPIDLDLDGDLDLVGHHWSKEIRRENPACMPIWGTTFFINEGDLVFTSVDMMDVFPELTIPAQFPSDSANNDSSPAKCAIMGWGNFFPTQITESGMTGLSVAPVEYDVGNPRLRVLRIRTEGLLGQSSVDQ